jgi:hypothetical protein
LSVKVKLYFPGIQRSWLIGVMHAENLSMIVNNLLSQRQVLCVKKGEVITEDNDILGKHYFKTKWGML